jgi:hypothetical protein
MTSDKFPSTDGLINALLSIIVFSVFFFKPFKSKFSNSEKKQLAENSTAANNSFMQ